MGYKLIVVAPYYDTLMCNTIVDQYIKKEFKQKGGINLILTQDDPGKLSEHQARDFSVVVGAYIIDEEYAKTLINTFANEVIDVYVDQMLNDPDSMYYGTIGSAEHVTLSCNNGSVFKVNENIVKSERYIETLRRAENELEEIKSSISAEKGAYSAKVYNANARILQLRMKNYIYYIGANSSLQKQIIWDSVEDVIKCIKSAIKYGVVPGCQLSIIKACNEIEDELPKNENGSYSNEAAGKINILNIIKSAVISVYNKILNGPDYTGIIKTIPEWYNTPTTDEAIMDIRNQAREKSIAIIKDSIDKYQVFDIETLDYSDKIITSAETDIMVLQAASELVKILISGNQCIACDSDVDASHEEDREVYV
jgi:hypothetical protein